MEKNTKETIGADGRIYNRTVDDKYDELDPINNDIPFFDGNCRKDKQACKTPSFFLTNP